MAKSQKIVIRKVENGFFIKFNKQDCLNLQNIKQNNKYLIQKDRQIVDRILFGDGSTRKKNLETKKRKKRVNPRADAKKRQIGSNVQDFRK